MLQQVTDGVEQISASASDSSLDELMAELDGEVAEQAASAGVETDRELSSVMSELDAAISRGAQAARQAQQERPPVAASPVKDQPVEGAAAEAAKEA
jgi:hypothetical protein